MFVIVKLAVFLIIGLSVKIMFAFK